LVDKIGKGEAKEAKINGKDFKIDKEFIAKIETGSKIVSEEKYVPGVIEPSFGFGRIIYCLFEHKFRMRNEKRTFLSLPARIAPYKCAILTVTQLEEYAPYI